MNSTQGTLETSLPEPTIIMSTMDNQFWIVPKPGYKMTVTTQAGDSIRVLIQRAD